MNITWGEISLVNGYWELIFIKDKMQEATKANH